MGNVIDRLCMNMRDHSCANDPESVSPVCHLCRFNSNTGKIKLFNGKPHGA
jgi:hypothetical protein